VLHAPGSSLPLFLLPLLRFKRAGRGGGEVWVTDRFPFESVSAGAGAGREKNETRKEAGEGDGARRPTRTGTTPLATRLLVGDA